MAQVQRISVLGSPSHTQKLSMVNLELWGLIKKTTENEYEVPDHVIPCKHLLTLQMQIGNRLSYCIGLRVFSQYEFFSFLPSFKEVCGILVGV